MMILFVANLFAASKTPVPAGPTAAQLQRSCNKGKGADCDELGNRWRFGIGMSRSDARAADFFRKACAAKDPDGCADDAFAAGLGLGQKADAAGALARLGKQCKEGVARACGNLATLYSQGLGGPDDVKLAEPMWVDACKKGHLESCSNVSAAAFRDGDFGRFNKFGRAACDYGDPDGCASLAEFHLDLKELLPAAADYARACQLGSTRGCTGQGLLMLEAGTDLKRAASLLEQSCQREDPRACAAAGVAKDRK
jgi:TPR repeat protein